MSSNHADASAKVLDASDYYAIFDLDQASELQSEGAKKALRSKWRELTKLTHTDKSHDPRGEDAFSCRRRTRRSPTTKSANSTTPRSLVPTPVLRRLWVTRMQRV
jgi:hypothetical protein